MAGLGAFGAPVFDVQCPDPPGCAPVDAAGCRAAIRAAVREAIRLAKIAASKIDAAIQVPAANRDADAKRTVSAPKRSWRSLAFLRDFSCDLAGLKVDFDRSFVDIVFSKYTSVTQAADQITRRITALGEIAAIIDKHINEAKRTNREGLMLVLKGKLEKLKAERCGTGKGVRATGQGDSPTRG